MHIHTCVYSCLCVCVFHNNRYFPGCLDRPLFGEEAFDEAVAYLAQVCVCVVCVCVCVHACVCVYVCVSYVLTK